MSFLDSALSLSKKGFHVFPITPNKKAPPLIQDFPTQATRDEEKIKAWWNKWPDANIGISTSAFRDSEALVVIDIDVSNGKKGMETFEQLKGVHPFPATLAQKTPTGGRHIFYRHAYPLKQGVNVLGEGIDIRSKGGYVVGPGSVTPIGKYEMGSGDVHATPSWIEAEIGLPPSPPAIDTKAEAVFVAEEKLLPRIESYMKEEAPVAQEGSRNHTAFIVANRLKDMGCTPSLANESLSDWNQEKVFPPLDRQEVSAVVRSAFQSVLTLPGSSSPEAQFTAVAVVEGGEKSPLERINADHALTFMDRQPVILYENADIHGEVKLTYLTEAAFKRKFCHESFMDGAKKNRPIGDYWLTWSGKRTYDEVVFFPERDLGPRFYNKWRGFRVKGTPYKDATDAAKKGFDDFMSHLRRNIAGDNEDHARWIEGYFAHLVQRPWEKPGTCLVLRGAKGVGKNVFVERMTNLVPPMNWVLVDNARYLTSHFNEHFEECLLFILDEAVWGGDKSADASLKGLTTAGKTRIEPKFGKSRLVDSFVRPIILGNEEWMVPASHDERRYAVFEVKDHHKQNQVFFQALCDNMDKNGGLSVLFDYLKRFDLSTVNVKQIPHTNALLLQKEAGMDMLTSYLRDSLAAGFLLNSEFTDQWPETIQRTHFRDAYSRYCASRRITSRIETDVALGRKIQYLLNTSNGNRARLDGKLGYVYPFLPLDEARVAFSKHMHQEIDWEDYLG